AADVGICVAGAAPVARHAADAILVDKDLGVIEHGIVEGRRAALNASKYLKATLSANVGNVVSILRAGLFLPFLPMLPGQLLVQNVCYDAAQLALPLDRADPEQLRRPHRWSIRDLIAFVGFFALVSSAFDLLTYGVLEWVLPVGAAHREALFHSAWFVEGLVSQVLAVLVIRTGRFAFRRSRPSAPVTVAAVMACALGPLIPASPWAAALGMRPLPAGILAVVASIVVAYLFAVQALKPAYRRLAGRWL